MVIHAYDKTYLEKARTVLGRMLDFAVYDLGYEIDEFFALFLGSGIARRFEEGDFTILVGKSGVEIVYEVLEKSGIRVERRKPDYTANRSPEYWTGWALAYYQWDRNQKFSEIVRYFSLKDIMALYTPYHEMDIRQFCDKMDQLYRTAKPDSNLKYLRKRSGLSQKELAELSGVPVRTIQQYEQRQKDINRARGEYLLRLSSVLCCEIIDLMEKIEK